MYEKLKKAVEILDRENTPEEYKEAIEILKTILPVETKIIPREVWKRFWSGYLEEFIHNFYSYIVDDLSEPDDVEEAYLRGVYKGMLSIYNMIESLMVME